MPTSTLSRDLSISASLLPRAGGSLIEVGFWADPRDPEDGRPHPAKFKDEAWGRTVTSRAVVLYIESGFLESFELGYSFCRIAERCHKPGLHFTAGGVGNGYNVAMGCCTLTDGKYVWPEGLAHYVTIHSVRPPDEFISHALHNLSAIRKAQAGGRLRWNPESGGQTVALAPATAAFLRDRTTLGVALPPEPESEEDTLGGCSCIPS